MRSLEANKKPISTSTLVVASKPLRFGTELLARICRKSRGRELCRPALRHHRRCAEGRQARRARRSSRTSRCSRTKITGAGQRATLSALVRDGIKAVTIRVNDVDGVGGFVLPGDRVDVVMTRQVDKTEASNEVVLQNVRVLAIDQIADERAR